MIRELTGRRRLFSPRRLINELVRWVLGVHSPSGTIKVKNSANPGERSLALDIDMEAVLSSVDKHDEGKGLSKSQREDVRDVMRSCLDGNSLKWGDNCASVNADWLDKYLEDLIPEVPSADVGTAVDGTDSPNVYDSTGATLSWTAGGTDGLVLDCYCKIAPQTATSNYSVFQRCRMTFSKDGLMVSCQLMGDRIRIQAKNG